MKDEEMAEEYLTRTVCQGCRNICEGDCAYAKPVRLAFLAGLKAGRPQWHKVADELPTSDKDKYYFVVDKLNVYMIAKFYEGKWSNYAVIEDVIAWCEIPTFDKESEIKREIFPEITLPEESAEFVDKIIADTEKRLKEIE